MHVGDEVDFLGMKSIIRYIGPHEKKPGTWVGVELPKPKGKNNGTIQGKKYFECEENHGVFVQEEVFLGAVEKSRQQALARNQLIKSSSGPSSPSSVTPTKSTDSSQPSPIIRPTPSPSTPEDNTMDSKSSDLSMMNDSSTESISELAPIYEQIEKAKAEIDELKRKYTSEKQKYDQAKTQFNTIKQQHMERCSNFQVQLEQKLDQITLEGLRQKIQKEELIYEYLKKEKELQKITMCTSSRSQIEALEHIAEEHRQFEESLLAISKQYEKSLDRESKIKKDYDNKLLNYQNQIQKCIAQQNSMEEVLQQFRSQNESGSSLQLDKQYKNLAIQLEKTNFSIKSHDQSKAIALAQRQAIKDFIPLMKEFSKEIFVPIVISKRLEQKIPLLTPQNEVTEQLLHFCKITILFLNSDIVENPSIDTLIKELERIEKEVSEFKIPNIDFDGIINELQKCTPHSVSQAITSHLILSYAYRVKDTNLKSDLRQIAKLVHGIIHPLVYPKYHDDCDSLAIELRDILRQAEKSEKVVVNNLENKISIIQLSPVNIPTANLIRNPNRSDSDSHLVYKEHEMMPELRRRMRDAEALCKTYKNHIRSLKSCL